MRKFAIILPFKNDEFNFFHLFVEFEFHFIACLESLNFGGTGCCEKNLILPQFLI